MSKPPEGGTSERTIKHTDGALDDPFITGLEQGFNLKRVTLLRTPPGRPSFAAHASISLREIDGGGSRWTRTIDLTLIRRVL